VGEGGARHLERGRNVVERLARLGLDAASHELAVRAEADLARGVDEVAGPHGRRQGGVARAAVVDCDPGHHAAPIALLKRVKVSSRSRSPWAVETYQMPRPATQRPASARLRAKRR